LMLRDPKSEFYVNGVNDELRNWDELQSWLRGALWSLRMRAGIKQVCCLGTSMGGFAAILAGHALRVRRVWAFSPMVPDPGWQERLIEKLNMDNGVTTYDIWFGAENAIDRTLAHALGRCPRVTLHPWPTDSHLIAHELWLANRLPRLLDPPPSPPVAGALHREVSVDAVVEAIQMVLGPQAKPVTRDQSLLGVLDSFAVTFLLSLLEERLGVALDLTRLTQADLENAEQITAAIRRTLRARNAP
jgi:acyl carrier protein